MSDPHRFALRCSVLPPGHWHCKHGHLEDCPSASGCPPVVDGLSAFAVLAGRMCYLYTSDALAVSQIRMLVERGADVRVRRDMSSLEVDLLLASLPDDTGVEDWR